MLYDNGDYPAPPAQAWLVQREPAGSPFVRALLDLVPPRAEVLVYADDTFWRVVEKRDGTGWHCSTADPDYVFAPRITYDLLSDAQRQQVDQAASAYLAQRETLLRVQQTMIDARLEPR